MQLRSVALSFVVVVGCDDALVGGECLDGHREVEGTCVPTDADVGSGGRGAGGSPGADGGAAGATSEGGGPPPTSSSTGAGAGTSSSSGSSGSPCPDALVACGGACVDLRSDPHHCGACGNVCASGICEVGLCQGELAGHVVLCGFDADEVGGVAPARIVANAMFAWPVDPVRIAVLGDTSPVLEDVAIAEAAARGRAAALETIVDHDAMAARLDDGAVDVVVVAALPVDAVGAAIAGERLATGIAALTARGGVIMVLAPEAPASFGPFVESIGVATNVTADAAATDVLDVVAFDDALAAGLPSFFARPGGTLAFEAPSLGGRVVVTDRAGRAVVVHGVVDPNE